MIILQVYSDQQTIKPSEMLTVFSQFWCSSSWRLTNPTSQSTEVSNFLGPDSYIFKNMEMATVHHMAGPCDVKRCDFLIQN